MGAGNQRIVVLHVIESLRVGGAERQLSALIRRSDPGRFRHEVCVLSGTGGFADALQESGIRVHNLQRPGGALWPVLARLLRVVRSVQPDVIHATLFRPSVASRIVGRITGRPTVTTLVNTTYEPEWRWDNPGLTPAKVWLTQFIDRTTARWDARFVAVNESVKTSAVRQLGIPPERVTVIYRGLALDAPGPSGDAAAHKATLEWAGVYPLVLNVGRLVPQKGQRYAISAMRQVVTRFPGARLLIAGEGWQRPNLERQIRHEGLERHVTLLGEYRNVPLLLRAADIFVFPSLYEGFGNALVEAMAAGKPCVVSRIPGLLEVTGEGRAVLAVPLRAPGELAAAILRLAADRELAARLGRVAEGWVRQQFDFAASLKAHELLYEHLVAGRQLAHAGAPA